MEPVSRRRLRRLSLSVALLALLVGASWLALPLAVQALCGWQGSWLSAASGAAEPRVSRRLELRGEGLALDGAWRDGRLDLVGSVEARAGKQIIARLPEGQFFMDAAGRWRNK
ncbi:MAG: hypothetical protein ACX98W_04480 [bacterium]